MKDNFEQCFQWLLSHEGGYVDHPSDPGGATNLGVTKAVWEDWIGRQVSKDEIKALTVDDVRPLYRKKYFDAVKFDDLPAGVDWSVVDWAVNSGPKRASRALQRAIGVNADGVIGIRTLAALYAFEPDSVVKKIYHERQKFYESLKTFETFGRGWTRRNKETLEQSLHLIEKQ